MAERLTEYYYTDNNKPVYTIRYSNIHNYIEIGDDGVEDLIVQKLGKTEDIMEKYGIEDLEQYLLKMRKVDKEFRDTIQQLHTIIDSIGYDRDNWQKACELACDVILRFTDGCPCKADYFYQQAKKEGNDEQI